MKRYTVLGVLLGVTLVAVLVWAVGFGPARSLAQTRTPSVAPMTQTSASTTSLPRTITVVGEGTVKIKPDIARVTIGVETSGATVKTATTEASDLMNKVIAALKQQGVTEQDMQTSGYSVWTERNMRSDGQLGETTYRVNNILTITIRKLDQVGQVMDAAIEAGANVIHGMSFALDDPKSVEAEARSKAIANALSKANDLAQLTQVQVGQVVSVSEVVGGAGGYYNSNFINVESARMGMGGGGPVAPGELELAMRLEVVYAIQ